MPIRYSKGLFFLTLWLLVIAISGCGISRSLVGKVIPQGPELKKRVMVFPLVDQAGLGGERTSELDEDFKKLLGRSSHFLLYGPPDGIFSSSAMSSPIFGVVTSSKLIEIAEGIGMNALIIGVVNPIEVTTRKSGIWPFRSYKKFYEISMGVNVVDITTKTFSMTRIESEEYSVSLDDVERQGEKKIVDQALKEALPEILEGQASAVEEELTREPWTGRILAVENKTIMINAGKKVGLRPGQYFEVFEQGKSIPSASGRSIYLLGKKIGEIKVKSVMGKHSLAVPVKGGKFLRGQVIRFKR